MIQKLTKTTPPKVMSDISAPGSGGPADATTRPVIITNRPLVQDPMMVPLPVDDIETSSAVTSLPAAEPQSGLVIKRTITPISVDNHPTDANRPNELAMTPNQAETVYDHDADGVIEANEHAPEPSQPAMPHMAPFMPSAIKKPPAESSRAATSESTATDKPLPAVRRTLTDPRPIAPPAEADKTSSSVAASAAEAMEAPAEDLSDDKSYYLPINAAVHRRSRRIALFGLLLIIVLGLAWLNIAMDAGLVTVPGLHPLTHFFGTI